MRTRASLLIGASAALALASCELDEVAAPPGSDVLVVEAIMRAGAPRQGILLHRSLEGRAVRGEPGASVVVTTPDDVEVRFAEAPLTACLVESPSEWEVEDLDVLASCYRSATEAGYFVLPGRDYELSIETTGGERVRGRTTVPGLFSFSVPTVAVDSVTLSTTCLLPTTPFNLVWTQSNGAWAYISYLRLAGWGEELEAQGVEVPDPLELTGVSVSAADTTLLFPTNLGLFQRFEFDQRVLLALQQGIPPGADATLVILAADRNYTNAVRGGRFNPSGNIRGSSIVGDGVGVFGSIVPLRIASPAASVGSTMDPQPGQCPVPPGPPAPAGS